MSLLSVHDFSITLQRRRIVSDVFGIVAYFETTRDGSIFQALEAVR